MLIKRITTGVAVGVITGIAVWLGGIWFTLVAALAAALATREFYQIVRHEHLQPLTYPGIFFAVLFVLQASFPLPHTCEFFLAFMIVSFLIWMLFKRDKDNAFINVAWTIMGILYIGWMLSFYILIRNLENGMGWAFMILFCTALCDVFAFAVGSKLGKHPLSASISPNKTIEGALGGLAGSIIFAVLLSIFFKLPLDYWQMVVAGIIIGILAQIGDLVESILKRNMKTKDAGDMLPGHGGILDRIDSHLLTGPVAYYLIILLF